MKALLLTLAFLLAVLPAFPAANTVGPVSTNFGYLDSKGILRGKAPEFGGPGMVSVYDTFDVPDMTLPNYVKYKNQHPEQFNGNSIAYTWHFFGSSDDSTNRVGVQGGSLGWLANNAPFGTPGDGGHGGHLMCSNNFANHFWVSAGGLVYWTNSNILNGQVSSTPLLFLVDGAPSIPAMTFLHVTFDNGFAHLERGINGGGGETLLNETYPVYNLQAGVRYPINVTVVTNTILYQIGNNFWTITHSNMAAFAGNARAVSWEIIGGSDYNLVFRWDAIWASTQVDPAVGLLLGQNRVTTNGMLATATVYKPTMTTNTYLNGPNDGVIGINGATATSTLWMTNKLFQCPNTDGTFCAGRTVTVYDATGNASATTNLWITAEGQKINNGPDRTNIVNAFGSLTFMSTETGWQVVSKFP